MNEFYIVDGKIYEVSPSKKEEFLQKFPNAVIRTEEVAKTAGVETSAATPTGKALDMGFNLENGSSVLQEPIETITPIQSIKNAFSNVIKDTKRVAEFWTGESAAAELATAAIWEEAIGRDNTEKIKQKYGDTWFTQGLGVNEIVGNIEEAEKELSKEQTIGIIESIESGDVGQMAGAAISTVVNALGSVGYYLGTAGTGYFFDYAAENYIDYNEQKAKRSNKTLEQLIGENQDETIAPVSIAFAQTALEKVGMGKILKGFGKNLTGTSSKLVDLLKVGGTEAVTEVNQQLLTKFNQRLSEDGNEALALEKVLKEDLFSAETLETGLQGFVGGAGARGAGIAISETASAIGSSKVKIDPKLTMAVRTSEEAKNIEEGFTELVNVTNLFRKTKNTEVKDLAQEKINEAKDKISNAVLAGRQKIDKLSTTEKRRVSAYSNETITQAKKFLEAKQAYEIGILTDEDFSLIAEKAKQKHKESIDKINTVLKIANKIERQVEEASKYANVQIINTQEEFNKKFPSAAVKEVQDGEKTTLNIVDAVVDQNGDIFINRQGAERLNVITSASHELLHNVLRNTTTFKLNEKGDYVNLDQALKTVNEFESIVDTFDTDGIIRKRLQENYNIERNQEGKIIGGDVEEYLTVFSDAIIDGDVKVEQSFLQRIKDFFLNILRKFGFVNADFKSTDDVYNFVIDYSKTFAEKDVVSNRAQKLLSRQEIKDLKSFNSERQEMLNKRVDDLVGEKDDAGNYAVTKTDYMNTSIANVYDAIIEGNYIDPLITRRIEGNSVYGKPLETFISDVKDELVSTIMNFDPEKNNSLIGWINSQLSWKKQAVLNKYQKEVGTTSIDIDAGDIGAVRELAAEEQDFEETIDIFDAEQERIEGLIRPAEIIGDPDLVQQNVSAKMNELSLEDISFKKVPNLVAEFISGYMNIPVKKIIDPKANLSTSEYRAAQNTIFKDRAKLIKLLPKGAVVEAARQDLIGTSTGVKKNLLKVFYEKDPVRRTEAAGLWEFKLKENISEKEFLKAFGIEENGDNIKGKGPRDSEGQTIKAFSDLLGKLVTNTEVRKILAERGYDAKTIQDIAAGKNEAMFSRRTEVEKKLERREAMTLDQMENKFAAILSTKDKRYTPGEQIDKATAKNMSLDRKKRFNVVAPTADDFVGLLYRFLAKGKIGEEQMDFFKEQLILPFGRAFNTLNAARQTISKDYKELVKRNKDTQKKLRQQSGVGGFTFEDALRVHLYTKAGYEPKGLSQENINRLNKIVLKNKDLFNYGVELSGILRQEEYWVEPDGASWQVDNIKSDINRAIEQVSRKRFLSEWIENKNAIFSENNMNKILATYGEDFVRSLNDILYRMENGVSNPERGLTPELNQFLNWFRGSVGVTMFLNTRSAVLQTISFANFINWSDNNIFKASSAFANQPQFWSDFAFIFNSDYLKERRGGLKTDVNAADLADAVNRAKDAYSGYKSVVATMLQKGFVLTQLGDSFAISFGGAMFYRNRLNNYLSQGLTEQEAQEKAFLDFQELSEEAQQSARPDKLSMQQTSEIGRIFLAFQNTPMQYARLTTKAFTDLINKRGDQRSNVSKIVYYAFAQSIIFASLQQALNLFNIFDEEEDEEKQKRKEQKVETIANNVIDSFVRGIGLRGAYFSAAKNTIATFLEQEEKQTTGEGRTDHTYTLIEALNVSPPVGIKARKMYGGIQQYKYNKNVIEEVGLNIENPVFDVTTTGVSVLLNIPADRALTKARNVKSAFDQDLELWQQIMSLAGWNRWNLGIENKELDEIKKEQKQKIKEIKKKKSQKSKFTRKLF
jgi:hypothetical protein